MAVGARRETTKHNGACDFGPCGREAREGREELRSSTRPIEKESGRPARGRRTGGVVRVNEKRPGERGEAMKGMLSGIGTRSIDRARRLAHRSRALFLGGLTR